MAPKKESGYEVLHSKGGGKMKVPVSEALHLVGSAKPETCIQ